MELGANFVSKLEPFMLMAKSVKGAAAAKLIQDTTSAPGVFVFTELLELPNIQELVNSEQHSQYFALLQLFSYKTYQDYIKHKDAYPPLNNAQIVKLKHLSIVTLSMQHRILSYSMLKEALDMPTVRELEDLIIDAIYLDILRGKLDQKEGQFEVEYTMGRDLEPGKVEDVLATLKDWAATTAAVLSTLDQELLTIASHTAAVKTYQEEHEKALVANIRELERQKEKGGINMLLRRSYMGGTNVLGGGADKDSMDIDEPPESMKAKNRKAPQEAIAKQQRKRNRF